jgi:hypothetical protein
MNGLVILECPVCVSTMFALTQKRAVVEAALCLAMLALSSLGHVGIPAKSLTILPMLVFFLTVASRSCMGRLFWGRLFMAFVFPYDSTVNYPGWATFLNM